MSEIVRLGVYPAEQTATIAWEGKRFEISATNLRLLIGLAMQDLRNASPTVRGNMEPIIQALDKLANMMLSVGGDQMTPEQTNQCLDRYHATGSGADVTGLQEFLSAKSA